MNTKVLAARIIDFPLGGLVVSTAAQLEDNGSEPPTHLSSLHQLLDPEYAGAGYGRGMPL